MEKQENMTCQRNKSIIELQWGPVSKMSGKESMKERVIQVLKEADTRDF